MVCLANLKREKSQTKPIEETMKLIPVIFLSLSANLCIMAEESSWPQWRGPERNGVSASKVKLADSWPEDGPKLLWESEYIPSGDDGGYGSVVAMNGKAFMAIVWHRQVPTKTRTVDNLVLRKLGARRTNLPKEVVDAMEKTRTNLSPRLRGTKLDEWAKKWIDENLDEKQKLLYGDYVISRFKKGSTAFPIEATNKLYSIKDKIFPNEKSFEEWLDEQGFDTKIHERILNQVPPTKKVAEDVILALDMKTGTTLWQSKLKGIPSGRNSSATPCVSNGFVYAVGSNRVFCVEAEKGKMVWDKQVGSTGGASSIMVTDGRAIALIDRLTAFDAKTGDKLWENTDITGRTASPALWKFKGRTEIVCNSRKSVIGVDASSGKTLWEAPGGGSSTPVASGDLLIVHAKDENAGIVCYRRAEKGVEQVWKFPKLTRRTDSSPIITDKYVFLFGAEMRLCLDLSTGKVLAKEVAKHDISSPIMADGKIFAYEIKGSFLDMVNANPDDFTEIGKTKVRALRCSSPAIVGSKLLVRMENRIACYELGE